MGAEDAVDVYGSKSSVSKLQDKERTDSSKEKEATLQERLMTAWVGLATKACGASGSTVAQPEWGPHLHRWGAAFSREVLPQALSVPTVKLSICGDFVGSRAGS